MARSKCRRRFVGKTLRAFLARAGMVLGMATALLWAPSVVWVAGGLILGAAIGSSLGRLLFPPSLTDPRNLQPQRS